MEAAPDVSLFSSEVNICMRNHAADIMKDNEEKFLRKLNKLCSPINKSAKRGH
jgi:hypothetical protein